MVSSVPSSVLMICIAGLDHEILFYSEDRVLKHCDMRPYWLKIPNSEDRSANTPQQPNSSAQ
jgi:hypothetical protein